LSLLRWACVASLACGATAAAEEARPIVALTFLGPDADRVAFTASLSELLIRIEIDLVVRQTDAPLPKDRLLAIVTADWSAPADVTINIVDAQEKVVLVRRLARAGSPSVVIEAATHITQSVIEELAHPTVPLTPPPVVAVPMRPLRPTVEAQAPPAAAAPQTGLALEIAGFAGARGYGSSGPPVSPSGGIRLGLTLAGGRWRPSAWVSGEYQAPIELQQPLFHLKIDTVPLRAGAGLTAFAGDAWRLDAGLGAGADLFFTNPSPGLVPEARLRRPSVIASPIITGLIALHVAVARSADVWLAVTLDADLTPRRWVIAAGPVREAVFAPWQFRPSVQLGFSFGALGPAPYASRLGGVE